MVEALLVGAIFAAALLYSLVGHGGGSGYLAVMALAGVASAEMKPAALVLNILVAGIGSVQFLRAGAFSWRLYWPFALAAAPAAFIGGRIELAAVYYRPVVGLALIFAAWRLFIGARGASATENRAQAPRLAVALPVGAALGLLSGLTGVGGGVFLSPLLLLCGWGAAREVAGVSALFILGNSIAGLAGHLTHNVSLPEALPAWLVAAGMGGLIGSWIGARRLPPPALRRALAAVLLFAGFKLALL
jgi:uncharacterized membrane protein YfcA